jgi:hypothetical protein
MMIKFIIDVVVFCCAILLFSGIVLATANYWANRGGQSQ